MGFLNAGSEVSDFSVVTLSTIASPDVDSLVRTHLPLVTYVANELAGRLPSHLHRDDLISAGMAGLAEAAMSFDADAGVPFHRFAAIRVKGAMMDELRSADWATRGARSREKEYTSAQARLAQVLGRVPEPAELAAELGVDLPQLQERRKEMERRTLSLDALDATVGHSIPDASPDPSQLVIHAERVGYLRAAVAALPERSRTVITGLFLEQRSITEIADELDVSESRVSQLKTEALGLLHDALGVVHGDDTPAAPRVPAQGAAARRKEAYYSTVAANAARAGLGSGAAALRAPVTSAVNPNVTQMAHTNFLRTSASRPM